MIQSATLSSDDLYRYTLSRQLPQAMGQAHRRVLFVMLNPSTADAIRDDATIRRCRGFAERLRGTDLLVGNLYALRTTKPEHLLHHPDPVGPANLSALDHLVGLADLIVAAWGADGDKVAEAFGIPSPVDALLDMAEQADVDVTCLGITADGSPRHPLYLPSDAPCVPWP